MTLGMLFKEGRRRNLSPLWVKITGGSDDTTEDPLA